MIWCQVCDSRISLLVLCTHRRNTHRHYSHFEGMRLAPYHDAKELIEGIIVALLGLLTINNLRRIIKNIIIIKNTTITMITIAAGGMANSVLMEDVG